MARKSRTYAELMRMAEQYGVQDNALFVSAAAQYTMQAEVIERIKAALDADDRAVITKEYVKGRENLQANPLILQLPKHIDSANRTLGTMLDIIQRLGRERTVQRFGDVTDD